MTVPWDSLFGGVLLGASCVLLLVFNGKIAGISGILNGLFMPKSGDYGWRLLFTLGLTVGGAAVVVLGGTEMPTTEWLSIREIIVAGLLVGVGTRLANGCTSGHGICGIGRLSKRSIVATCIFMFAAAVTVFFRLHVNG